MRTPDSGYVSTVLAATEAPCVSIYLTTRRHANDPADLARFHALAQQAEAILAKEHAAAAPGITGHLRVLLKDEEFWSTAQDGVVVLASPTRFDAFTLPRAVPEHVEVGDSFHVKPLLRYAQSAEPFHVLGVSRERVALFRGNRYVLAPMPAPGVQLANTALPQNPAPKDASAHLAGPDAHAEAQRFFLEVDRQVIHRVSEPSGLPLILAGVEENLAAFRGITKNRFLTAESIHGDWTNLTLHEIREAAWKVFEKHYLDRLARIREDFGTAAAHKRGTADLAEAAKAAAIGRIGVLLIDADRSVPGSIDMTSGTPHAAKDQACPGDMLDDLAEMGLKTKAMVIVTPSDQMPTKTGLAAIFRY